MAYFISALILVGSFVLRAMLGARLFDETHDEHTQKLHPYLRGKGDPNGRNGERIIVAISLGTLLCCFGGVTLLFASMDTQLHWPIPTALSLLLVLVIWEAIVGQKLRNFGDFGEKRCIGDLAQLRFSNAFRLAWRGQVIAIVGPMFSMAAIMLPF